MDRHLLGGRSTRRSREYQRCPNRAKGKIKMEKESGRRSTGGRQQAPKWEGEGQQREGLEDQACCNPEEASCCGHYHVSGVVTNRRPVYGGFSDVEDTVFLEGNDEDRYVEPY